MDTIADSPKEARVSRARMIATLSTAVAVAVAALGWVEDALRSRALLLAGLYLTFALSETVAPFVPTLSAEERARLLAHALEALPGCQRKLLHDQGSWTEMAGHSGAPAGTLRVRAHRSCQRLRELLDSEAFEAA